MSDERMCTCEGSEDERGLFIWRGDKEWWSCCCCDGRVRPRADNDPTYEDLWAEVIPTAETTSTSITVSRIFDGNDPTDAARWLLS